MTPGIALEGQRSPNDWPSSGFMSTSDSLTGQPYLDDQVAISFDTCQMCSRQLSMILLNLDSCQLIDIGLLCSRRELFEGHDALPIGGGEPPSAAAC